MTRWGVVRQRYQVATDPLRTERRIELVAVLLVLLLCLQFLYSGARLLLAPALDIVAPAADALRVKRVDSPLVVAGSQSEELRSRPLFWQTRRPAEDTGAAPAAEQGEAQAGQLKDIRLLGVFGSGDTAGIIALVRDEKRRILQGESVEGWTVDTVESHRVVLVDGVKKAELVLKTGVPAAVEEAALPDSPPLKPAAAPNGAGKAAANGASAGTSAGKGAINKRAAVPLALPEGQSMPGVRRAPAPAPKNSGGND